MLKELKLKRIEHILAFKFTGKEREILLSPYSPITILREMPNDTMKTTLAVIWAMLHHRKKIVVHYDPWVDEREFLRTLPDPCAVISKQNLWRTKQIYNSYRDTLRSRWCFVPKLEIVAR